MKSKRISLYLAISACLCGCSLPICEQDELVCGKRADNGVDILFKQHSRFSSNGDINTEQCQLFQCIDDSYVEVQNGECKKGSIFENNLLHCIPNCVQNERVCGKRNDQTSEIDIMLSPSASKDARNESPCQMYECLNDEYIEIENSYCSLGSYIVDGIVKCIPQCNENEIVCGVRTNETIDIKQYGFSSDTQTINETPCQLYRCINNQYEDIQGGECKRGSMFENGVLGCISNCWNMPDIRCGVDNSGKTHVERCSNEADSTWISDDCEFSCHYLEDDYSDGIYQHGECGKCVNGKVNYCIGEMNGDDIEYIKMSCINGTIVEDGECDLDVYNKQCDDHLVDIRTDDTNCGGCYMHCGESEKCTDGKCILDSCETTGYMTYPLNGEKIRAYCIPDAATLKEVHDALQNKRVYPDAGNEYNAYIITGEPDSIISYPDVWEPLNWTDDDKGLIVIGQNHTIKFEQEITNQTSGSHYTGVFGRINNATIDGLFIQADIVHHNIENINWNDESMTAYNYQIEQGAGGIAGYINNSTIQNSQFSGHIRGTKNIGGIIGVAEGDSKIIHSKSLNGSITAGPYLNDNQKCNALSTINEENLLATNLGGIAGFMYNSSLSDCTSEIELHSQNNLPLVNVGGLVGQLNGASNITDSHRNADITVGGVHIGGLAGYVDAPTLWTEPTIKNTYFAAFEESTDDKTQDYKQRSAPLKIQSNITYKDIEDFDVAAACQIEFDDDTYYPSDSVGGLIGKSTGLGVLKIIHSFVNTDITAYRNVGGFIGSSDSNVRIDGFMNFIESFDYIEFFLQAYDEIMRKGLLEGITDLDFDNPQFENTRKYLGEYLETPISKLGIRANHAAGGLIGQASGDIYIANTNLVNENVVANLIIIAYFVRKDDISFDTEAAVLKLVEEAKNGNDLESIFPVHITLDQLHKNIAEPFKSNNNFNAIDMGGGGGLIGINNNATGTTDISTTYVASTIRGNTDIGGFIGVNHSPAMISLFFSFADLFANKNVGGVIGHDDSSRLIMTNSYATSAVTIFRDFFVSVISISPNSSEDEPETPMDSGNCGGLVGSLSAKAKGTISALRKLNLYARVNSDGPNAGGVVGNISDKIVEDNSGEQPCDDCAVNIDIIMNNSRNSVTGTANVGGLIGYTNRTALLENITINDLKVSQNGLPNPAEKSGIGGLIGYISGTQGVSVKKSYVAADVSGVIAGGLFGAIERTTPLAAQSGIEVSASLVNSRVSGTQFAGSVAGAVVFPTAVMITNSGIIGAVSVPSLVPTACIGGIFGQYAAPVLGLTASYLYVDSNQIARGETPSTVPCNGNIAGHIESIQITGNQFYYWNAYSQLDPDGVIATNIGTPFIDIADDGKLNVDNNPENNIALFTENDKTTVSTVKIKRRKVEGEECDVVQFKALFNSIIKNITRVCLTE